MMQNRSVLAAFSVLAVLDTAIELHTGFLGGEFTPNSGIII